MGLHQKTEDSFSFIKELKLRLEKIFPIATKEKI